MQTDKKNRFVVTGGSGYIASWIVKYLLEAGYEVNTTVRNLSHKDKYEHLLKLSEEHPGRLNIIEADLLKEGSFDSAVKDRDILIHTASPFFIQNIKDPQKELVDPAVLGTENILGSANRSPSVKRVVLTSSVAAVYGDSSDIADIPSGAFNEDCWNETSSLHHQPYNFSKTMAEKKAWEIAGQQHQWDLVVINPGFVLGPSLSKRADGVSTDFMLSMADGRFKTGIPGLYFGIVDVRDVAGAHIRGATVSKANGRNIVVNEVLSTIDIAGILRSLYGNKFPFPKIKVPTALFYLVGPFMGYSWKYIRKNVDIPVRFNNSKGLSDLGIHYRPVSETLKDQIEQLTGSGILRIKDQKQEL